MNSNEILQALPYEEPFLFVDTISEISEAGCSGSYTFNENAYFYQGHFKNHPVTPGVILTECMAQIGLVCLGIFLVKGKAKETIQIALCNHTIDFYKPVYPNETIRVTSVKEYFRFNKLKCQVRMLDSQGELIAKGTISGMIKK